MDAQHPDLPIVYCNPGFVQLSGYPPKEVLGRNCHFLKGPTTNPETVARLRRAIHEGRAALILLSNYRKDGQLWLWAWWPMGWLSYNESG